ncbi:hypothetical protein SCHPADRAFT_993271 [Schizopora paradoxa]|uniref:RNA-dependent RNA polymerase n=1 Tax=Schizopora paradoxa TaxID=27342 RepID=A0A0H2S4C3_9AGAM|nr:hypothetical protein SCHPADRAFT_993271 [Schizopora paradoxa]
MAIGNEESPTRRSGRRDSSRRGARNIFRTGPSPGQEVIDVDADEETMDVLEVAALIGRGGRSTPEPLARSQSSSSQIYWDQTSHLIPAFESLLDATQPVVTDPPKSISTLASLRSEGSTATTIFTRTNSSTSEGSASSASVLGKRSASDVFGPLELAKDGLLSRNARLRPDPENPFESCNDAGASAIKPIKKGPDCNTPVFIAHSGHYVDIFKSRELCTGVQWELARLVSNGRLRSYDNLEVSVLDTLKGSNAEAAPRVEQAVLKTAFPHLFTDKNSQFAKAFAKESAHKFPWKELDEEEAWLRQSEYNGLGCDAAVMSNGKEYYGGKVHFIAKLKGEKGNYTLCLEGAELGPSCRFYRRFGSAAFIKVSTPKKLAYSRDHGLMDFMLRPFVLNGRVFRAFYHKENNVHLKKTNERVVDNRVVPPENESDLVDGQGSLEDFLNWHNPPGENLDKTMVKYTARTALGLSNSVPAVVVPAGKMYDLDDISSKEYTGHGKLPSELDMTDGCGFINAHALRIIQQKLDLETLPTAVQVRFCGGKGLLCLDKDGKYNVENQHEPSVGLRPSQVKINHQKDLIELDRTLRTVEVLRTSRMTYPARLSAEIIINLSENGVDDDVFKALMRLGLEEISSGLTCWDSDLPNAMCHLWTNVARSGGVITARLARLAAGESRARGYGDREDEDSDEEDEDDIDQAAFQKSTAWWADPISGCPSSLEETVLVLIDSGFKPHTCPVLAEKLKQVLKVALEKYVYRFKMIVPMSCEALVIPDPIGVLGEGEVHIKRSHPMIGPDCFETEIVLGDVLVTRHPCKVPSDVQKVKAVQHPALTQYVDVIIFSVCGKQSLASMLGGGDYDGDRVYAIWQPEIVSKFQNADIKFASTPPEVLCAFEKNSESVEDFLERAPSESPRHIQERQKYLLSGLAGQSLVGQYSLLHDKSVYALGYSDPLTIYAAYMFCNVLDGSKTGLRVKKDVLKADMNKLFGLPPEWRTTAEAKGQEQQPSRDNKVAVKRSKGHKRFIMDIIMEEGKKAMNHHLKLYDSKVDGCWKVEDEALTKPWLNAVKWVNQLKQWGDDIHLAALSELEEIRKHVEKVRKSHRSQVAPSSPSKKLSENSPSKKKSASADSSTSFTNKKIEARQDILRALSKEFAEGPKSLQLIVDGVMDVRQIKASYAYIHDREESKKNFTRFPWDCAMGALGEIKAKEEGLTKTETMDMYENKTMHSSFRLPKVFKFDTKTI